jgi:hypothetical protein
VMYIIQKVAKLNALEIEMYAAELEIKKKEL